jgi:hypothetical protein
LLRNVFHVLFVPQNSTCYCKDAVLVPPDKYLERLLVIMLRPPHQLSVISPPSFVRRFLG